MRMVMERELVPGDMFIYESYASETYPFDASETSTNIVAYKKAAHSPKTYYTPCRNPGIVIPTAATFIVIATGLGCFEPSKSVPNRLDVTDRVVTNRNVISEERVWSLKEHGRPVTLVMMLAPCKTEYEPVKLVEMAETLRGHFFFDTEHMRSFSGEVPPGSIKLL